MRGRICVVYFQNPVQITQINTAKLNDQSHPKKRMEYMRYFNQKI